MSRAIQRGLFDEQPSTLIDVGSIIETNYGTGPYRVLSINGPCDCPSFVDTINNLGGDPPRSRPHVHMTCEQVNTGKGGYILSGYDPDTLESVWGDDKITVLEP